MPLSGLAVVVVAAGAARRMGFPKLWTDICGRPLLTYAIAAAGAANPSELILVVSPDRVDAAAHLVQRSHDATRWHIVAGGTRRRDSVAAGIAVTSAEWLAIHDAARALAPADLFARGLAAAQATGAAVPGLPLKDTIKRVGNSRVVETPERAEHVAVQTPQIFRREILIRAMSLIDDDVTDEAALVERLGYSVAVFDGDERAFKVTTPFDFALARALVADDPQHL